MAEKDMTPASLNKDVGSTTESVGAVVPGRADFLVVLAATIAASDVEGKATFFPKGIKSIYREGDHFVLLTTTATGELLELKVSPDQTFILMPSVKA